MTRQEYIDLGKQVKAKQPAYEDMDDYELGKNYFEQYLSDEPPIPSPLTDPPPPFNIAKVFPGIRAGYKKRQVEYIAASYAVENSVVQNEHGRRYRQEAQEQVVELSRAMHEGMMVGHEAAVQSQIIGAQQNAAAHPHQLAQIAKAGKLGILPTQLNALNEKKLLGPIEAANKDLLEESRLKGYAKEVEIDLKAALVKRLMDHKTAVGTLDEIHSLLRLRTGLHNDPSMDDYSKKIAVDEVDVTIEKFRKAHREQMERHLLSAGDGEDVQGVHEEEDGAAHNKGTG